MVFSIELSSQVSEEGKKQLREKGSGHIRVSLGTLLNKKDFISADLGAEDSFRDATLSTDSLPHKLLQHYWWQTERIDIDDSLLHIYADATVHVEGEAGQLADIGFILQWSGAPFFTDGNEPVVSLVLDHIRSVLSP
jgi:hypothetical protein